MSDKRIEDVIDKALVGDAERNALDLIAHIRASGNGHFAITMHDEKDESGWVVSDLCFIIIKGSDYFPESWTMWLGADNIGQHSEAPVDEDIKQYAWSHVSPCGSCGGNCSPGKSAKIFGKDFENTCQSNLMFVDPDIDDVDFIKEIIDIRLNDIIKSA